MAVCCEDFHCLDDTSAVLPIFRSYHYGENANETVRRSLQMKNMFFVR